MNKGRIVVVEDEAIVARDIQATLRSFGYEVPEIVTSGEEAIQAAYRLNPDLIMMDIMIKGAMDGIDAAEIIRSQFNIPVVYLTAYSDDETLRRAKLTESYGFISKPFDERELYVAVEFALYKHQMNFKVIEAKTLFEGILKNFSEAIVVLDKEDKIFFVNPRAEKVLGWKEHELKSRSINEIIPMGIFDSNHQEQAFAYQSRGGANVALTFRMDLIRDEKGIVIGKLIIFKLAPEEIKGPLRNLNG